MRTASTCKARASFLWLSLGSALLVFLHLFRLTSVAGLHFDEAWAYLYSWKLSHGVLTFQAMSPYTAPWTHYWAALWLRLLGPGLLVFRLSQVSLSLAGILLTVLALWKRGKKSAALFLPLTIALLPSLVLNHRFAIELDGWHVFCFGLGVLALASDLPWLVAVAWVLGSTGHVLFYGFGLSVLVALLWQGYPFRRRERAAAVSACLLLAVFFVSVLFGVPEKAKAAALVFSAFFLAALLLLQAERWRLWRWKGWGFLAGIAALVFLANACFFLEGSWSLSLVTGREYWHGLRLPALLFAALLLAALAWRGARFFSPITQKAFLLSVICLGLMMLKPAPRYFELVLLMLAVFIAQGWAQLPTKGRALVGILLALHGFFLYVPYFTVTPREAPLHLLFFKDSSRDFLAKQKLAAVLGGYGCGLSDIKQVDFRVLEALTALSLGDWPKAGGGCRFSALSIREKTMGTNAAGSLDAAGFTIGESP